MTECRCIPEQLADIINGTKTINEIVDEIVNAGSTALYGINFYEPETNAEDKVLQKLREAYKAKIAEKKKQTKEKPHIPMVTCTCGHTILANLVMTTSFGTSCPDCYDRMSEA